MSLSYLLRGLGEVIISAMCVVFIAMFFIVVLLPTVVVTYFAGSFMLSGLLALGVPADLAGFVAIMVAVVTCVTCLSITEAYLNV